MAPVPASKMTISRWGYRKAEKEISGGRKEMLKKSKKILAMFLAATMACTTLAGCAGGVYTENENRKDALSFDDAKSELKALMSKISIKTVENPTLDIYSDEVSEKDTLADISTFPITVEGKGQVIVEIAAATEFSSDAPDDWLNIVARNFNKSNQRTSSGKSIGISIRKMASGEVVTYVRAGAYRPTCFVPSNDAWGKMLEASGIGVTKVTDRIAGNTAGVLMEKSVYKTFIEKYQDPTIANVLKAANAGDITFAYTNPYTSSTGLNILTAMLKAFDEKDPLSAKASEALLEYQKTAPPVAYTTGVLRNQAKKGLISAMVMEEQAYINTPELKSFEYFPVGIRHDHPVYGFDWNTDEENEAIKLFTEYCLSSENQKLATEKGFNRHDEYQGQDSGLTGTGYLSAQATWKQNKNGGKPVIAVFVADVSGSMRGEPLSSLQTSMVNASSYIGSEHYVGLVSYASSVTINLPINQFEAKQRAYFSGEVKNLSASGNTATYDAVLVALDMIEKKLEEIPDAKPMIFVLTDGDQNEGFSLNRITGIVGGLQVPVYAIAYNYHNTGDLDTLSKINEATTIKADTDDVVNQLRNLFNVQM